MVSHLFRPLALAFALGLAALILMARPAAAQDDQVWVQIEAQPTLAEAQAAIRRYGGRLQDVNGFTLDGGWYAVALGPYSREDAGRVLFVLRSEGAIPRDSYIAFPSAYRRQFYPVGANQTAAVPEPTPTPAPQPAPQDRDQNQDQAQAPVPAPQPDAGPAVDAGPALPDESPAEARQSERLLTRDERMELQEMLRWAGFYNAAIDGAFGRGTRSSMADWQSANNHEATGILTTGQRSELRSQYNAILDGLGLQLVRDDTAGIEVRMPTGIVAFDRYASPFAHYDPTGDSPARVILISQAGDRQTLRALYEIMQTLEIVPETGDRQRRDGSFTIEGRNGRIVSYTEAALEGGQIKGFTLVWPTGDEERRTRLLTEMRASFRSLSNVLPASAGIGEEQRIDLVSGLEVRKPMRVRAGFYVDDAGSVVTADAAVAGCSRVTLDGGIVARAAHRDAATGIAVLRPEDRIAPLATASFATSVPRLKSGVAVAGFPYEGILGAPTLTYGELVDLRGLNGEAHLTRLALAAQAGDAGGPVFDAGGAVLGMLLPAQDGAGRQLPGDVSFAADAQSIRDALTAAGIRPVEGAVAAALAPEDLARLADGVTVQVACWE